MARPNLLKRLAGMIEALPDMSQGLISYQAIADKMGCSVDEAMEMMSDLGDCDLGLASSSQGIGFLSLDGQTCREMLQRARRAGAGDKTLAAIEAMLPWGGIAVQGGFGVLSEPPRLTAPEARALASALDFSHVQDQCALRDKLLGAVMPVGQPECADEDAENGDALRSSVRAYVDAVGHYDKLRELSLLCDQRRLADIVYVSAALEGTVQPDNVAPRRIAPLQVRTAQNGEVYLHAFCFRHQGIRTFRIDRIVDIQPLGQHFDDVSVLATLAQGQADDLDLQLIDEAADQALLRVPGGQDIDPRIWLGARRIDDTGLFAVPLREDRTWIARQIAASFGQIEVVEPASLRDEVAAMARALLADLDEVASEFAGA